jgi:hypothetical protein
MKKVVSGGPANGTALREPCRPFGYNPVELSRFAGGGPLWYLNVPPARWLRVFTTRRLSGIASALVSRSRRVFFSGFRQPDIDCFRRFFPTSHGDSPPRLSRRLFLGDQS